MPSQEPLGKQHPSHFHRVALGLGQCLGLGKRGSCLIEHGALAKHVGRIEQQLASRGVVRRDELERPPVELRANPRVEHGRTFGGQAEKATGRLHELVRVRIPANGSE